MLSDEFLKNCFGSSDDEDEKFEIKHKKDRIVSYHPNSNNKTKEKRKNKNKNPRKKNLSVEDKDKIYKSDNSLIPIERRISIDMSKFKLEKKKYHIEYDYGNIEYKLKLCDVTVQRIQELTSQMKFRLGEGCGECYYEIGVEDNGNTLGISKQELEISLSVINTIAINLGCQTKIMKLIQGKEGLIAEMYIKKQEENLLSKIEKRKYHIEYDYGNVEYKLKLCDVTVQRIQELTSQMNFRLREGCGECYYEIGVEDNGHTLGISKQELEISLSVINTIAVNLGCQTKVMKLIQGEKGLIAEMFIKKQEENLLNKIEITLGVLGLEGTGKSTIIGVLINGVLDDGKGLARQNVLRHKHEIFSGKTSSFSHQILGFDEEGNINNYGDLLRPSKSQIVSKSTKIINFYDMAGGNKTFNRTTLPTLSNEYLDWGEHQSENT